MNTILRRNEEREGGKEEGRKEVRREQGRKEGKGKIGGKNKASHFDSVNGLGDHVYLSQPTC